MNRMGEWFLYALFILFVTGLLLYLRFPEEVVRQYLVHQADKVLSPYELTIGAVKPAMPPGLTLREVTLWHGRKQYPILEQLKITPDYTSVFNPGRNLILTAGAYGGRMICQTNLYPYDSTPQGNAEATAANVDLKTIDWLQKVLQRSISGRLSGKFFWDTANTDAPLQARFRVTGGHVDLRAPIFSLKKLTFTRIETDITLNRKRMLIRRCTFNGKQLEGNLSGSINLQSPLGESILSLSGIIKIRPEFIKHMQKNLPQGLLSRKKATAGYPVSISGTLDKPGFSLK